MVAKLGRDWKITKCTVKSKYFYRQCGIGIEQNSFWWHAFQNFEKNGLPQWARQKRTKYSRTPLASLFLTRILIEKPCKEGEGNKKDVSFCSLFHSLYWKFEKLYYNNTLTLGMSFCVPLNNAKKINSTAKR